MTKADMDAWAALLRGQYGIAWPVDGEDTDEASD